MPNDSPFFGMRGTGDFATDERPKSWREGILRLFPNGSVPLTAVMSKSKKEKVDDPEFNWWTKTLARQMATISSIYTNSSLSTLVSGGNAASTGLYLKLDTGESYAQFRAGHEVLLQSSIDSLVDVAGIITSVNPDGNFIAVKTLEADDNSASHNLSDVDVVSIIGNANAELADRPEPISSNPVKHTNYTQIFRNSLGMSRTARETKLRTVEAYGEAKRETLELHGMEMEKAMIFGYKSEELNSSVNGKPRRFTGGIKNFIIDNAPENVSDYRNDPTYAGVPWLDGGEDWLDEYIFKAFEFTPPGASGERLGLIGRLFLQKIQTLVKKSKGARFEFTPRTAAYGIKVVEWHTVSGSIYLKIHPLFKYSTVHANSMLVIDPSMLRWRYVTDTKFKGSRNLQESVGAGPDGLEEEYLTEGGLEIHYPETMLWLTGGGLDNTMAGGN